MLPAQQEITIVSARSLDCHGPPTCFYGFEDFASATDKSFSNVESDRAAS